MTIPPRLQSAGCLPADLPRRQCYFRNCLGVLAVLLGLTGTTKAAVLQVGTGQTYPDLTTAAAAAKPGDTVHIAAGTYFACAIWTAPHLTIEGEGEGEGTIITDQACQGKAGFVIQGADTLVRDLTFTRMRVPDGNGAGIRAEAANLRVQRVRFINNQIGLLTAMPPESELLLEQCSFQDNGAASDSRLAASLLVGQIARLVLRDTSFARGKAGAAIASSASLTDIEGGTIEAAARPDGALSGPTIQLSGALRMHGVSLQPSAMPDGSLIAVKALPGATGDRTLVLTNNTLTKPGILLLNWSGLPTQLSGNTLAPGSTAESSDGATSARARGILHSTYETTKSTARHMARVTLDTIEGLWTGTH